MRKMIVIRRAIQIYPMLIFPECKLSTNPITDGKILVMFLFKKNINIQCSSYFFTKCVPSQTTLHFRINHISAPESFALSVTFSSINWKVSPVGTQFFALSGTFALSEFALSDFYCIPFISISYVQDLL